MKTLMFAITIASAIALTPANARATDSKLEELAVQLADSPEEHAAVASYFRSKAKDATEEAEAHRVMAKHYTGGKLKDKETMADHCAKMAANYEELAKQYEQLAAEHEKQGK